MKHSRLNHVLLALAFAIGQWFAVVHSTQHELSSGDRLVACEICAVGHAATPPPATLAVSLSFQTGADKPAALPTATPQRTLFLRPPTRGPPSLHA